MKTMVTIHRMEKCILKNYTQSLSCGSERGFYVVSVVVSVLASERMGCVYEQALSSRQGWTIIAGIDSRPWLG